MNNDLSIELAAAYANLRSHKAALLQALAALAAVYDTTRYTEAQRRELIGTAADNIHQLLVIDRAR